MVDNDEKTVPKPPKHPPKKKPDEKSILIAFF